MKTEIGSIFEIDIETLFKEPLNSSITFPFMDGGKYDISFFNTGRTAIKAILRSLSCRRVFMPSYNCTSVIEAAEKAGCAISLYPVEADMSVKTETVYSLKPEKGDILYIIQYFGKPYSSEFISAVRNCGVTVIEDISMCLLSDAGDSIGFGDYIIGSIRKWLPVPDGGFVASKKGLPEFAKETAHNSYSFNYLVAQLMKSRYMQNPSLDKERFLEYSTESMETLFSDWSEREMSRFSADILLKTDIKAAAQRRKENYDTLYGMLNDIPGVSPLTARENGMLPLGMVLMTEERDGLFKHLIEKGIYCNIHWRPNAYSEQYEGSDRLSGLCLTIPCDQRYGQAEMEYIADAVAGYFKR